MAILFAKFLFVGREFKLTVKAPKGQIFEIRDLFCTVTGGGAGSVEVYRRAIEFDEPMTSRKHDNDLIAEWFTSSSGVLPAYHYQDPIRTKFFNVNKLESTGAAIVIVSGRIKKAGKTELLWEWFRKGR